MYQLIIKKNNTTLKLKIKSYDLLAANINKALREGFEELTIIQEINKTLEFTLPPDEYTKL